MSFIDKVIDKGKDLVNKAGNSAKDLVKKSTDPKSFEDILSKAWDLGIEGLKAYSGSGMESAVATAAQLATSKYGYDQQLKGVQEQNASAQVIADKANALSQQNAREQMAFQADQSATAHQREVKDLRAAGLNPVLSGTGGMGASSGSGASGSVVAAPVQNERGSAITTALNAFQTMASAMKANADREFVQKVQTPNTQVQTENIKEDTRVKSQTVLTQQATRKQIFASTKKIEKETENLESVNELTKEQKNKVQAEIANLKEQFKNLKMIGDVSDTEYAKFMELAKRATDNVTALPSLMSFVKSLKSLK